MTDPKPFLSPRAELPNNNWKGLWHLTKVIIPRRSITGEFVRGPVWRRHDDRKWIYKAFVDPDEEHHH